MSGGELGCVIVAVDGGEESMNALRWALKNLKLRSTPPEGSLVILHVQSPPSISAGLSPGAIPFGGPSYVCFLSFFQFIYHTSIQHCFLQYPCFSITLQYEFN